MRPACAEPGCETRAWTQGFCFVHRPNKPAPAPTFPIEPLAALVEARGGLVACGAEPHTTLYTNYHRAKRTGEVTVLMADRFAHRLFGLHPCEIWGNWFDISTEMSHGSTSYVPQAGCAGVDA